MNWLFGGNSQPAQPPQPPVQPAQPVQPMQPAGPVFPRPGPVFIEHEVRSILISAATVLVALLAYMIDFDLCSDWSQLVP